MTLSVYDVRAEYRSDSPYVGVATPRLSWKTRTKVTDWAQGSAELEWENAGRREVAHISSSESVFVPWPFSSLRPRERGRLRVRVTGSDGAISAWSDPLEIRAGFLGDGEWTAEFMTVPEPDTTEGPILLRREFDVRDGLREATLYATAHGVYQAELNGAAVDDQVLKPGWTSYQFRLVHESTEVTALLVPGRNVLGAVVCGGWYTESFGFFGRSRPFYGRHPSFAAQLVLEFEDGTVEVVRTGHPGWRVTPSGPIVSSGIYAGEVYDARRRIPGWSCPGLDDRGWPVAKAIAEAIVPVPRTAPPVRATEMVPAANVLTTPSGRTVVDFGQNLVGRVRIRVQGQEGDVVVLRHAEVLENGELAVRPLRAAKATDVYTLAGTGEEIWEPAFTFHGFRYVEIEGWPGKLDPGDVTAVIIHSDLGRTGWFSSSNAAINRLHENVVWSMRGNFLSLPTDCPQRDERLGWTGDIQVFAPTGSYLYDCDGFLSSWLEDLSVEQAAFGGVPHVVPDVLSSAGAPAAGWGDAATIVPWVLWERYADRAVLERQYPSMRAWVDQVASIAGPRRLWEGGFQFGDWLDPDAPPERPGMAKTDPDIVASAYFYRSTSIVAASAGELGRDGDVERYSALAEEVRAAWLNEYTTPAGRVVSDAPTAYALAIMFEIARDDETINKMGDRLAWLVRKNGYRVGTGFAGTPLVQDALVRAGHIDTARRLLMQTEAPSWLYAVTMGATTIWERWDSMLEDGSINPGEMTSFNHYAYGAIADWLHRAVAGLAVATPGYRVLSIAPVPLAGIDWAETENETPYGRARVRWDATTDGRVLVQAVVPPNSRATVSLPGVAPVVVGSGDYTWEIADPRLHTTPRPVSLASTLADIIDDEQAYAAVVSAIADIDPLREREVRRNTAWTASQTLSDALTSESSELVRRVDSVLAKLNNERGALEGDGQFPTRAGELVTAASRKTPSAN